MNSDPLACCEGFPDRALMPSTIRRGKVGEYPRPAITPTAHGRTIFTGAIGPSRCRSFSLPAAARKLCFGWRLVSGRSAIRPPAPSLDRPAKGQCLAPLWTPAAAPSARSPRSLPTSAPGPCYRAGRACFLLELAWVCCRKLTGDEAIGALGFPVTTASSTSIGDAALPANPCESHDQAHF
jgi:hypothetical protein